MVSASLVSRFLGGADPIGQRMTFQMAGRPFEAEIVGVVDALRHEALDRPPRPEVFVPLAQLPYGKMTFVMRTAVEPAGLLTAASAQIWAVDPLQSVYRTATLDELVSRTVQPRRFAVLLLSAFAGIALLLAAVGLYGVLSAVTSSRLREIGVRVALGASAWDVLRWLAGRGLAIVGIGIAIGLACALGTARLLRGFLYQVEPLDPFAIGGACALMLLVAVLACFGPARRALRADPVEVLRAE